MQNLSDIAVRLKNNIQVEEDNNVIPFPEPQCEQCDGQGVLKYNVPFGHAYFGKIFPCDAPNCPARARTRQERAESLVNSLKKRGLSEKFYEGVDIDEIHRTFEANGGYEAGNLSKWVALRLAHQFVLTGEMDFEQAMIDARVPQETRKRARREVNVKNSLVLTGEKGVGKTLLLSAIRNELFYSGQAVVCLRVRDMLKAIQEDNLIDVYNYPHHQRLSDILGDCATLLLDECDLERMTDDRLDVFEDIIDQRMRERLPVIITTNLGIDEFSARWGSRTASRLADVAHWLQVKGVVLRDTSQVVEI